MKTENQNDELGGLTPFSDPFFRTGTFPRNVFRKDTPMPRLIFLTANIEVLEARIVSRNRAYELVGRKAIAEAVAQAEEFRAKFSDKIVLTLDTTNATIDYVSEVSSVIYECERRRGRSDNLITSFF